MQKKTQKTQKKDAKKASDAPKAPKKEKFDIRAEQKRAFRERNGATLSVSVTISDDGGSFVAKIDGGDTLSEANVPENPLEQFLFFSVMESCLAEIIENAKKRKEIFKKMKKDLLNNSEKE